jgi:hypothetical protein
MGDWALNRLVGAMPAQRRGVMTVYEHFRFLGIFGTERFDVVKPPNSPPTVYISTIQPALKQASDDSLRSVLISRNSEQTCPSPGRPRYALII